MIHEWFMYFVFDFCDYCTKYTVHFYPEKLESAECRFHSKFDRIKAADLKNSRGRFMLQYTLYSIHSPLKMNMPDSSSQMFRYSRAQ